MRDIVFRGKEETSNEWAYGSLIFKSKEYCEILQVIKYDSIESNNWGWSHVDYKTIGQYTGLKDKNGKMIFEGDIVKVDFDPTDTFEVIYFKCGFKLRSKDCCTLYDYSIHDESHDIEVIGNVYDNPELLKEIR